jgi:hypothetical protein
MKSRLDEILTGLLSITNSNPSRNDAIELWSQDALVPVAFIGHRREGAPAPVYGEANFLRRLLWSAVAALGIVTAATAISADSVRFPMMRTIGVPTNAAAGIALFKLDEDIFAKTDDAYANMRIFDSRGHEVPFLVRVAKHTRPVVTEFAVPMATISFEKQHDNRIEIVTESRSNDVSPSVVVVVTDRKDYEKQVTVSGSKDCAIWEILALNTPIFDYSRQINLRNNRIEISPGHYRYYKLEIGNFSESHQSPLVSIVRETNAGLITKETEESTFVNEEFKVDDIKFLEKRESVAETENESQFHPVHDLIVTNDSEKQDTIISIDVRRSPVASLTVFARDANFNRSVDVCGTDRLEEEATRNQGRTRIEEWHRVVSSVISKVELGEFRQDRTTIRFDKTRRYRRYRIIVRNMDSPPLNIYGVKAEGEVHEALFFCNPKHQYKLLYGAKSVDAPRYDISDVLDKTVGVGSEPCALGDEEQNPHFNSALAESDQTIVRGRSLLVGAILLMVGTLVWLIIAAVRGLNRMA